MTVFTTRLLIALFVLGLSSISYAGMLEDVAETTEKVNNTAQEAVKMKNDTKQQAIEAQDASKTEGDTMVQDAKEEAKSIVNQSIDDLGK